MIEKVSLREKRSVKFQAIRHAHGKRKKYPVAINHEKMRKNHNPSLPGKDRAIFYKEVFSFSLSLRSGSQVMMTFRLRRGNLFSLLSLPHRRESSIVQHKPSKKLDPFLYNRHVLFFVDFVGNQNMLFIGVIWARFIV